MIVKRQKNMKRAVKIVIGIAIIGAAVMGGKYLISHNYSIKSLVGELWILNNCNSLASLYLYCCIIIFGLLSNEFQNDDCDQTFSHFSKALCLVLQKPLIFQNTIMISWIKIHNQEWSSQSINKRSFH